MLGRFSFRIMVAAALLCAPALAQQSDPQLPDAPGQQPQAQPPQPPPPPANDPQDSQDQNKKPESKIKKRIKRGAPNCLKIGGMEKCKESKPEEDEQADDSEQPPAPQQPRVPASDPVPRSVNPSESSSKDTEFPEAESERAARAAAAGNNSSAASNRSDVRELRPYNPHKADQNVEIGDFYFKRNNYRAAESRYAEALEYMPNHAEATFKLAQSQDKLGEAPRARENYEKYLKILPGGPFAEAARKALARLDARAKESPPTSPPVQKPR